MYDSSLLTALGILDKASNLGVRLRLEDNDIIVQSRKNEVPDAILIEEIRMNKPALVDYFEKYLRAELQKEVIGAIVKFDRNEVSEIPLSFGQERIWMIDRLQGSLQYHLPYIIEMDGYVDLSALEAAFREVLNRHEVLRTVIREVEGNVSQVVKKSDGWRMICVDCKDMQFNTGSGRVTDLIQQSIEKPFDLSEDYMVHVKAVLLAEDKFLVIAVLHHIASDGQSVGLFMKEVEELYSRKISNGNFSLPGLALQYADYAFWQRKYISGKNLESGIAYWVTRLSGLSSLDFPLDYARPAEQSIKGGLVTLKVPSNLQGWIKTMANETGSTIFMVMLSVFKVLLYKYTEQTDIAVGIPVSGRQQKELDRSIGFFVNTIVSRLTVKGEGSFRELLLDVRQSTLTATEYQFVPFEKVVEAMNIERDLSRNPLFQIMFSLQNSNSEEDFEFADCKAKNVGVLHAFAQFDLNFQVSVSRLDMNLSLTYCSDLFHKSTAERVLKHFVNIISDLKNKFDAPVDSLVLLDKEEENNVKRAFQGQSVDFGWASSVVQLFHKQVVVSPGEAAVSYINETISYETLNSRSNQVAHYLLKQGIGGGMIVPICVNRSLEMIIGILGILKAGCAYLPVDPDYPADLISYMLSDSSATIVLTSGDCNKVIPASMHQFLLDDERHLLDECAVTNPDIGVEPGDLCYVLYTSGSTGRPKGVLVEHQSVVNRLLWAKETFKTTAQDVIFQKTTFCFDVSVWELFLPLISSSKLVFAMPGLQGDADYIREMMLQLPITMIHFVPSMLQSFLANLDEPEHYPQLRAIICSGEELKSSAVQLCRKLLPEVEVYNLYGPTEAAIDVTAKKMEGSYDKMQTVSIGKPVHNTRIYVLNSKLSLCPIGIKGEIVIGGIQVARGYLNQDGLTKEKFIEDCFVPGGKLYRTGDIGRWEADGNISFFGRIDNQIKLRGYRIEPGEIERVIELYDSVRQAIVLVFEQTALVKRLIAYLTTDTAKNSDSAQEKLAFKTFLRDHLPNYMVPEQIIYLESIPLMSNGKVDKKILFSMAESYTYGISSGLNAAPRNEFEGIMVDIWKELLGLQHVGIFDNFFTIGGDSIISIQIVSRAKRFKYFLKPRDLFHYQSISELSEMISSRKQQIDLDSEQHEMSGECGLLPIQQWFFDQHEINHSHFNQSVLLSLDKAVDKEQLELIFNILVSHHDALRFTYSDEGNGWRQFYKESSLVMVDGENLEDIEDYREMADEINRRSNIIQRLLEIKKGIVFRIVLFTTHASQTHNRLLIVMNHLVVDGVSWRILMEDFELLILGVISGEFIPLGSKTSSVRSWHQGLVKYAATQKCSKQLDLWTRVFKDDHPLETDKIVKMPANAGNNRKIRHIAAILDSKYTRQLLSEVHAAYHTEITDLLLAALVRVIFTKRNASQVLIDLEGHGRLSEFVMGYDLSRTVGWFTTIYPVKLTTSAGIVASDGLLLKDVKEQIRTIPDKGLGFGVLKFISKEPSLSNTRYGDIVFNYLGQADNIVTGKKMFGRAEESSGDNQGREYVGKQPIALSSIVVDGELNVDWGYNNMNFSDETIQLIAGEYIEELKILIDHCLDRLASGNQEKTPSDYGLNGIVSNAELESFLSEYDGDVMRRWVVESMYRLSGLQEGILYHGLYSVNSNAYVDQLCFELEDADPSLIQASWQLIFERHSILRSCFYYDRFNVPVQCVYRNASLPFYEIDYSYMEKEELESSFKSYEEMDRQSGFNFVKGPLIRISLIRTSETVFRMVVTYNHIILDGWSLPVLMEEFLRFYDGLKNGRELKEPEFQDKFEDYIRYLEQHRNGSEESYWRIFLAGISGGTLLPFINSATERNKGVGLYKELSLKINNDLTQLLNNYAQRNHITVNTIMQGVWAYLLHCYTNSDRVIYGVTVSGRPEDMAGIEKRVGMFINTIPLLSELREDQKVSAWLVEIQDSQVNSREYQFTSLTDIKQWLKISGDLFDSIVVFENYPVEKGQSGNSLLALNNISFREQTNYPLAITISAGNIIDILFAYNSDMIEEIYAASFKSNFENILIQIAESSAEINTRELTLLSNREKGLLVDGFNKTDFEFAGHKNLVDLFNEQVLLNPDATAIEFGLQCLSYAQLNQRSNQLGNYLQKKGVTAGTLVLICMDRSIDMIIGIFGILKAGAAYVPLDPEYPLERIRYIAEESKSDWILTDDHCTAIVSNIGGGKQTVSIEKISPELAIQDSTAIKMDLKSSGLAYVIYTSGSTGSPKGVMVTNRSLVNFLSFMKNDLSVKSGDSILALTTYNFDISCLEMFLPLISGAKSILCSTAQARDAAALIALIYKYGPTFMQATPSTWQMLLDNGWKNETRLAILTGGEMLPEKLKDDLVALTGLPIINLYGPTETTIWSTIARIGPGDKTNIGVPIGNTKVYILDRWMNLLPPGVPGELYISGEGVSKGYLNSAELTESRFVANHFDQKFKVMYRTGDICSWLPNGTILYKGRADNQLKVRGYRIEPLEIESILEMNPSIGKALITDWEDAGGYRRLIGYVSVKDGYNQESILDDLKKKLPVYMIPSQIMVIDKFPMTPNNKVDKKALPSPVTTRKEGCVQPRNPTENQLVQIWQKLLDVKEVSIYDTFFELGGHSILAVRLAAAINRAFEIELSLREVIALPSVAQMAKYIGRRKDVDTALHNENITKYGASVGPDLQFAENKYGGSSMAETTRATVSAGDHVSLLQAGGDGCPIFIVPGLNGISDYFHDLAREFKGICPVYGLNMMGVFINEKPLDDIRAIAAQNVKWIQQVRPSAPYRLLAHSFGGPVAYEMARQLERQGLQVELLVIIESTSNLNKEAISVDDRLDLIKNIVNYSLESITGANEEHVKKLNELRSILAVSKKKTWLKKVLEFIKKNWHITDNNVVFIARLIELRIINAHIEYTASGKVKAKIIVVKSTSVDWGSYDKSLGWYKHSADVKVNSVAGNHLSMLQNDSAIELAKIIREELVSES